MNKMRRRSCSSAEHRSRNGLTQSTYSSSARDRLPLPNKMQLRLMALLCSCGAAVLSGRLHHEQEDSTQRARAVIIDHDHDIDDHDIDVGGSSSSVLPEEQRQEQDATENQAQQEQDAVDQGHAPHSLHVREDDINGREDDINGRDEEKNDDGHKDKHDGASGVPSSPERVNHHHHHLLEDDTTSFALNTSSTSLTQESKVAPSCKAPAVRGLTWIQEKQQKATEQPPNVQRQGNPYSGQKYEINCALNNCDYACCKAGTWTLDSTDENSCTAKCSGLGWKKELYTRPVIREEKKNRCENYSDSNWVPCQWHLFYIEEDRFVRCGEDRHCVTPWSEWAPSGEDCTMKSETLTRSRTVAEWRTGGTECTGNAPATQESKNRDNSCYKEPCGAFKSKTDICGAGDNYRWRPSKSESEYKCEESVCTKANDQGKCCVERCNKQVVCDEDDNYVPKEHIDTLWCASAPCKHSVDRDTCCDLRATCKSNNGDDACGSGASYRLRDDKEDTLCMGATCKQDDDKAICCQMQCKANLCDGTATTAGSNVPKRDRDKLYCKNSICTADKDQNTCCKPCDCTCPNGTPEATCTVATAGKEDCAKCNQDEDKPGRNYCLRYISPGDENGRQKCGKCTSICDNGNAEDPGYSTRDGEHLCASCHKGFYLHNDKSCHRCKCTCLNGIAKSGSACECTSTSSERVNCNSCNKPGRGKANNYCERNIKGTNLKQCQKCTATCEHGTPKPAGWVKFDNENNCASCDNIAALITSPEHSAYKICEKRICVCPIPHNQPDYEPTTSDRVGVAPVGAECPRHGMLKCKSCYQENGYEMNATTSLCVWKVCTCPGGTPVEGPPCNHTGLHHCGNCTGPKYVLEIPMIPGLGSNLTTVPETSTWAWAQGVYVDANASDIVEDTGPTLPYCRRACVSLAPPEGEEEDSNDENATITSAEDDDPDATREEASDEDAASSSSSMLNFHDYLYDKNINKNKLQTKMRGKLRNSRTSSRKRTLRTEHKTDKKSTTLFTSTSHNTTRTRMTRRKALAVDHIGQTSDPQIIDADDEPLEENKSSSELEDDEIDPDDDNDPDDENDPDDDEEMGGATSRKEISKNSGVPRRARASAHRSSHLQQTTWRSRDNETDTRDEDEVTDESKEICFAVKREVLTEDKGPLCKTHICKRDDDHEVCCGLLCAADKAKLAPICEKFGKEVDDEALCDHRDCTPGLCCRDLSFLALHGAKLGVGGVLVLLYLYQSGYFSVGDAFEAEIEDE